MARLTPRPDVAKRDGSPCPKRVSLGGDPAGGAPAGWPLADHSEPAAKPAAPVAKPAAACFRNCLRPDRLASMIASRDSEFPIELCLGANAFANQLYSV